MVECIGRVGSDLAEVRRWTEKVALCDILQTAFAPGRRECWFGTGIDVVSRTLVQGSSSEMVEALGERFYPTWNSAILFRYESGVWIAKHRDPACFSEWGVIVNIGEATFVEYCDNGEILTDLEDGAVYRFRTDLPHGVLAVHETRYSLLFRRIRPEYLALQSIATGDCDVRPNH